MRNRIWTAVLLLTISATPQLASAQYFGQNKVRHENFDFKVLKTDHFDIYYYDEEADVVRDLGRMAERWYLRLSEVLDHDLSSRQPVIIYASHPPFRATTVLPDFIGETTGGVTEGLRRRVVLPFAGSLKETDHVLGHELVHAFQYDIGRRGDPMAAASLPLWFIEGMAEYLSVGPADTQTAMWMRDAVLRELLPDIDHLDDPRYFPYRYGHAFWAYLAGKYGDDVIARILRRATDSGDVAEAIGRVLSVNPKVLSQEWHDALRAEYQPILRASLESVELGTTLIQADRSGGQVNVGPALSPDGSQMIFYSERDLFSIDLYLADARTGEIKDKITETALDAHVDSLQFVNSAGAWTRDGQRFAFSSIRDGRPEISVFNVENRKTEQRVAFPQLGEIYNITWSPDGRSVAFSAMAGAVTDIFILDLKTENLRQLTDDAFADLQPAWSPDGTR
ncbi:MAG TPA: basic secretory protein-like protein, partial [Terriglobia bacterium]|nr:basic secretory protein-like protein [Terriglobia bacterium]